MIRFNHSTENKQEYLRCLLQEDEQTVGDDSNSLSKEETKKLRLAFKYAHDIRKFEIELFWKRAAHFWVFISIIFVAYGTLFMALSNALSENLLKSHLIVGYLLLILLNAIGFIMSWIWIKVMEGSKFWQENWESHIDMLEFHFFGNLHKTTIYRDGDKSKHYSVSCLSEYVGRLFVVSWGLAYLVGAVIIVLAIKQYQIIAWIIFIIIPFIVKYFLCKIEKECRRPREPLKKNDKSKSKP